MQLQVLSRRHSGRSKKFSSKEGKRGEKLNTKGETNKRYNIS